MDMWFVSSFWLLQIKKPTEITDISEVVVPLSVPTSSARGLRFRDILASTVWAAF